MSVELTDVESVDKFHSFLMGGKPPEGFVLKQRPKLTARKAFAIIYVLQEHFHAIPDSFEMCSHCTRIYDSEREGHYSEQHPHHWCGNCEHLAPTEEQ